MIDTALKTRLINLGSTERARLTTEGALTRTAQVLGVTRSALDEALQEVRSEYRDPPVATNALAGASATQAPVAQRSVWAEAPALPTLGLRNERQAGAPPSAPLSFRGAHAPVARFTSRVELTLQTAGGDADRQVRRLAEHLSTEGFLGGADAWDVVLAPEPGGRVRVALELGGDERVGGMAAAIAGALQGDPAVKPDGAATTGGPWTNYVHGGGGSAPAGEPGLSGRSGDLGVATFATRLVFTLDGSNDEAVRRLGQHVGVAGKGALASGWDLVVLGSEGGQTRVGLELVGGQVNVQQARAAVEQAVAADASLGAVSPKLIGEWGNYG